MFLSLFLNIVGVFEQSRVCNGSRVYDCNVNGVLISSHRNSCFASYVSNRSRCLLLTWHCQSSLHFTLSFCVEYVLLCRKEKDPWLCHRQKERENALNNQWLSTTRWRHDNNYWPGHQWIKDIQKWYLHPRLAVLMFDCFLRILQQDHVSIFTNIVIIRVSRTEY